MANSPLTKHDSWEPSEAQLSYWQRMRTRRGSSTSRWKGEAAGKQSKHKWLDNNYGQPEICEYPKCEGKCKYYDWCLKTGHKYTHDRSDYFRMCRSCHRKYDMTKEKRMLAVRNLHWFKGSLKLTPEMIREIRSKYKPWVYSSRMVGKEYGISQQTVLSIVNHKIWAHLW